MANRTIAGLTTRALSSTDVLPTQAADGATEAGKNTVSELKTAMSLNNVDNTSDANKPVSTAQSTAITDGLAAKQATLVSGTNIKTVNGFSLLGAGNLAIGSQFTELIFRITQSGTAAPTISIKSNTIGGTMTPTRTGTGSYRITHSGAGFGPAPFCMPSNRFAASSGTNFIEINCARIDDSTIGITTYLGANGSGTLTDGLLTNEPFIIYGV